MHDNSTLFILVVALLIIGTALIYNFFFSPYSIIKKKLYNANRTSVSLFQSGEIAKVVGEVKYFGQPLIAPLSGRKCVYYHILVLQRRSIDISTSSHWITLIEEEVAGNMLIKDGNNYAVLETNKIKNCLLNNKRDYDSDFHNDSNSNLEKYLTTHGKNSVGLFGLNKWISYTEEILEEGEILAVVGKGTWKRKNEVKLDIPSEKILVIGCPDEQVPVFFSADSKVVNQDGKSI